MALARQALAIKFDLAGRPPSDPEPLCVSHYVDDDTQVVVKVKVGSGPHQKISLEVTT